MNLNREIERASKAVAFEWPEVIDSEEAAQEIWVKLLESRSYIDQIEQMNDTQRAESLRRIGHQIASRYRADYDRFTGNVYYGSQEVRKRLESGLLSAAYEETESGTETLTEYLDITEGLQLLKEKNKGHADALLSAYVFNDYDNSTKAKREFLRRARNSLTECMNQAHRRRHAAYEEGPGTRRVMRNSTAAVIKSHDYSGDYSNGRR